MFCIICRIDNTWKLFTNEIWLTEKEAIEYAKRNFKKSDEYKIDNYQNWFNTNKS